MGPEPFTVQVPAEVLDDLRSRLARTRWPDPLPYPGWMAGADIGYLRELAAYWASVFDWRAQERHLNSFAQFTADIDGQRVHFVHQRGRGPDPFPLVATEGGRVGQQRRELEQLRCGDPLAARLRLLRAPGLAGR